MFTIPVNGFGPEIQIVSSGFTYDCARTGVNLRGRLLQQGRSTRHRLTAPLLPPLLVSAGETVGGREFVNQSIFFGSNGAATYHSMQYMSSWEDGDGSLTDRLVPTVIGPLRSGSWWDLDFRPGRCEQRDTWKFPQRLCDKGTRLLASMFTVVMPQSGIAGSRVIQTLIPGATQGVIRSTRMGSMTHWGLRGNSSLSACDPPAPCGETTSRSWDPDLTGPFNHASYGGWYLSFDLGTPKHLSIQRIQLPEGATMVQAISLPPGTAASAVQSKSGRCCSVPSSMSADATRWRVSGTPSPRSGSS